ncbi:L-ascorbate metabolism protein UlaG (beta-lactamase superfamily) [Cryobacterium mesophilum]|uniref:MBL fold metallo-hydrolase n=1 Tax=Terrimesophilobacter mesophilus TaxID=433647 RepID=A0A4R8VC31_9MICO|nr:MBL fold metallo-hydrolase [Terrimesophilobacter mesophilus]MBB5633683.1 L-ascorbate metabolism protein UlaG (beta-lactamase superfamily) [Terrimesophilobacter mesophilus]TFB80373.1 MBL fold metallo-hydrolase [Terrimesophilobacter mesophilus]
MSDIAVTYIGGPTVLLEYAGLRILTDPTFDEPRRYPDPDGGQELVKTRGPALQPAELGRLDLVLLSHHHHEDNLDVSGRAVLAQVPRTLTTVEGASVLAGTAVGMAPGDTSSVGPVTVTATRSLHGPDAVAELLGPVIGFVLQSPGEPTVYLSGDNASLEVTREVADRFGGAPVMIVNAGAARVAEIDADLTFGSGAAAKSAVTMTAQCVIGVHTEDWEHFSESRTQLEEAFSAAGLAELLLDLPRGTRVPIDVVAD